MRYRGYEVLAEVEVHNFYSLDEDGTVGEYDSDGEGFDVTGYLYRNEESGDEFFEAQSEATPEEHRQAIDAHLGELEGLAA